MDGGIMRMIAKALGALITGAITFIIMFILIDWLGSLISPVFIYGAGFGIFLMLVLSEKRGR